MSDVTGHSESHEAVEVRSLQPEQPQLSLHDLRLLSRSEHRKVLKQSSEMHNGEDFALNHQEYISQQEKWLANQRKLRSLGATLKGNMKIYESIARPTHNEERDALLGMTAKMPVKILRDSVQQWRMHQRFLEHVSDTSPAILSEYTKDIHDVEVDCILHATQNMPLKEQWEIHQEFLDHIASVAPDLLSEYAEHICSCERDRTLRSTLQENREGELEILKQFLDRVKVLVPELLEGYTRYVLDVQGGRTMSRAREKPETEQRAAYEGFLTHVRTYYPKFEQEMLNRYRL